MIRDGRRVACKGRGRLIVKCEEISSNKEKFYLKLSGIKLPKMDFGEYLCRIFIMTISDMSYSIRPKLFG
eukprot:1364317-Amorphochlora_amoeboformis.AAC.1